MSDIIDDANDRAARDLALALQAARHPSRIEPLPCGLCYNCEASVPQGSCFCDVDCRDDYQKRLAARGA